MGKGRPQTVGCTQIMPILAAIALIGSIIVVPVTAIAPYHSVAQANVEEPSLSERVEPANIPPEASTMPSDVLCSCKRYITSQVPNMPLGDADSFTGNTTPTAGVVVLLRYKEISHMALIEKVSDSGISVRETNYKKCHYSERFIPWNDPSIVGFYSPNHDSIGSEDAGQIE